MNKTSLSFLLLSFFLLSHAWAQSDYIQLRGNLTDCEKDTLLFFQLNGNRVDVLGSLPLKAGENGKLLAVNLPSSLNKGFYFIGGGRPDNSRIVLINGEPLIQIQGACPALSKARVESPANRALADATAQSQVFNKETNNLFISYRRATAMKKPLGRIDSMFLDLDKRKLAHFEEVSKQFPLVGKVLGLTTYLSYPGYGKQSGKGEPQYFAGNYFQLVDFTDPFHDQNPYVQDACLTYARSLGKLGLDSEAQMGFVQTYLDQIIQAGSKGHKAMLLGMLNGFQGSNEDMYVKLGDLYLEYYTESNPSFSQSLKNQIDPIRNRIIGGMAPEIFLPTPEGDSLSLHSLRGEYVLIDFWASWCGPCRRENPRVRKVYEKYKDQGFQILGVSLDKSKAAWEKAIDADQLPWLHVSDLKYWSSVASRAYGVHSIPFTVLVDPEGKIIAKNLRGMGLDKKLGEIFGSKGGK